MNRPGQSIGLPREGGLECADGTAGKSCCRAQSGVRRDHESFLRARNYPLGALESTFRPRNVSVLIITIYLKGRKRLEC